MLDWGSIPDWLAGVGAVTALWFARKAAISAGKTNEQQAKQLSNQAKQIADANAEIKKRQATEVSLWLESGPDHQARYRISNRSGQPIYNLSAWWTRDPERGRTATLVLVPPGEWRIPERPTFPELREPLALTEDMQMPIEYTFTDLAQRHWKREEDGTLVQLETMTFSEYSFIAPIRPANS